MGRKVLAVIEPERLSAIIGSIYDCIVAPEKWEPTLTAIKDELGFATSALTVHDIQAMDVKLHVSVNMDDAEYASKKYARELVEIWGGAARAASYPLEEPIIQSEATPREGWVDNSWYTEYCHPRGLTDCAMLVLAKDPRMYGVLAFGQHADGGEITERAKNGLRLLAPHLRRSVVIGRLFEQQGMRAGTFSEVLDSVAAGIVIVDDGLGIIHANGPARAMLSNADPIQSRFGKLATANNLTTLVLTEAVSQAASNETTLGRRSIDLPAKWRDGTHSVVQVFPLRKRSFTRGIEQRAVAAVFVSNAAGPPRLPADALALMYDLTPAETRVFELVVAGKGRAEIAHELGIALATVKSHLARVFEKTGGRRQADLVMIAAKATMAL